MDIRLVEICLWPDESNFFIFSSNLCVFVRCRVGEQIISACVVPTVKHGGGGVMVWSCIASDTGCDLFRMATTAFCIDTPSHLVCA